MIEIQVRLYGSPFNYILMCEAPLGCLCPADQKLIQVNPLAVDAHNATPK